MFFCTLATILITSILIGLFCGFLLTDKPFEGFVCALWVGSICLAVGAGEGNFTPSDIETDSFKNMRAQIAYVKQFEKVKTIRNLSQVQITDAEGNSQVLQLRGKYLRLNMEGAK